MSTQNIFPSSTKIFTPGQPAPRGKSLITKGWLQEAALRMLLNNLDLYSFFITKLYISL